MTFTCEDLSLTSLDVMMTMTTMPQFERRRQPCSVNGDVDVTRMCPRRVYLSTSAHPSPPHRVYSSASARPSSLPCLLERSRSCIAPTVSSQAPALTHHPLCVFSSTTTRVSRPPHLFERNHSPVTPAASIRVSVLACQPHHIFSSATARVSPLLYPFERQRSPVTPTMSF